MKRYMILCMVICSLMGCGTSSSELIEMEKEYERIKQSDLSTEEQVAILTKFELNNPLHFDAKLVLGLYYMNEGDYEKARDYAKRAETVVKNAPSTDEGKRFVSLLYGLLAKIEFDMGFFVEAEIYAKKAINVHSEYGKEDYYILGQSQHAQDKNEEALKAFDVAFTKIPEKAKVEDLRAYMFLLATSGRLTECVPILERYFETGEYFSELGLFASTVYEKVGEIEKSILSAFLDYEFKSNYNGYEHGEFMSNLDDLETVLHSKDIDVIGLPVVELIRSLYDKDIIVEDTFSLFFIARYCVLTRKIMDNIVTSKDYEEYLLLEKYFKKFPVYYWNVWTMVKMLDPLELPNHTVLLETMINLQPDESSGNKAKHELGALIGLDESASENILTEKEHQLIVSEYLRTRNQILFDKIYSLFELPDNSYVAYAMEDLKGFIEHLKDTKQEYVLEDILRTKLQTADGLLQERLEYILQ